MEMMRRLFGREKPAIEKREAGTHYSEHIKPTMTVLVVGPSLSVLWDPSLLFVAHHLRNSGQILVCDPQSSQTNQEKLREQIRQSHDMVRGYGNAARYLAQMDIMRNAGLPLAKPIWLGQDSRAQRTRLESASLELIVDHNTSPYLAGMNLEPGMGDRENTLNTIYTEYARILKLGGTVLLQTSLGLYDSKVKKSQHGLIRETLAQAGFTTVQYPVADAFTLRVPLDFAYKYHECVNTQIRFSDAYDSGDSAPSFINTNTAYAMRFTHTDHFSPHLIIAKKAV